ncbi:MAG: urea transporter/murein DD-endopeptidase MepM/ murein hydrolase activator NlpD [Glaciecola sp.]|jgi:urea transporter/murein DD-endopeptidase MepM/ murein hydrolase activator NlpD
MKKLTLYKEAIVNSYGQVFFSNHAWFGYLLLLASFINPYVGFSGLLAGIISVLLVDWMGFNKELLRSGLYTFNTIMVGFIVGAFFEFNEAFFGILFLGSVFTTLISVWLSAFFSAYLIPFLSLPFILGVWTVLLGAKGFRAIKLSERDIFIINDLKRFWGDEIGQFIYDMTLIRFPLLIDIYLKSLGAIFFQYNLLVGGIIAIGLLLYSRIAFSLSIVGFLTGYYFCALLQGNMTELEYSYIGFNYILSAIALGGFFTIPSWRSYLLVVLASIMIALSISALGAFFYTFGLPIYSLPFSLVAMLLLYILLQRQSDKGLVLVKHQLYSPEKNLYAHKHSLERYKNDTYFHIHLPFFGEWFVSQAHDGKITHKEDWKFAFDFVIADDTQKTFRIPGDKTSDFYCYDLPVLAPADGYVVTLEDGIHDNEIGDVNLDKNWGNAIVIKHGDFLFSKITHIKEGSFKVKLGDHVKKGDLLAKCGNSGRSPEPHIHFQIQSTPYIGAKTLEYPLAYYISKDNGKHQFHSFEYPEEGQTIFKVSPTKLISEAMKFTPGMSFDFEVEKGRGNDVHKTRVHWEVFTNALNQTYFYCKETESTAYFVNNGTLHYFTEFHGDKKSLLHYFFLGAHKVLLAYYPEVEVKDILPITGFYNGISQYLQDFVAPFYIYLKADYVSKFTDIDNEMDPKYIKLQSSSTANIGSKKHSELLFEMELKNGIIHSFNIKKGEQCIQVKAI